MKTEDIEAFRVLAETLNYTNAASRLYVTQSSLTRTIQQMEEELGFQLFDRSRRSVTLTAAGRSFFENSGTLLEHYREAVDQARGASQGVKGSIRFAAHAFFVNSVVFDVIEGFRSEHPEIRLALSSSNTQSMIHDLSERSIDCAICTGWPVDREVERIVLRRYRDCLVVPPGHPLAEREEVAFRELKDEVFAIISRTVARRGFDTLHTKGAEAGFDPKYDELADSISHLMTIVAAGQHVTVLSDNYRALSGGRLKFIPLADESTVDLSFLWNRNNPNPCTAVLADYVRKNFKRKVGDAD